MADVVLYTDRTVVVDTAWLYNSSSSSTANTYYDLAASLRTLPSWVVAASGSAPAPAYQAVVDVPVMARKPAPLEFNKYINTSDLLQEFIAFLGTQKVHKDEIMGLPIELFIKWLIIKACEVDNEEPNVTLALPAPQPKPRCLGCGRFVTKQLNPPLHNEACATMLFQRRLRNRA